MQEKLCDALLGLSSVERAHAGELEKIVKTCVSNYEKDAPFPGRVNWNAVLAATFYRSLDAAVRGEYTARQTNTSRTLRAGWLIDDIVRHILLDGVATYQSPFDGTCFLLRASRVSRTWRDIAYSLSLHMNVLDTGSTSYTTSLWTNALISRMLFSPWQLVVASKLSNTGLPTGINNNMAGKIILALPRCQTLRIAHSAPTAFINLIERSLADTGTSFNRDESTHSVFPSLQTLYFEATAFFSVFLRPKLYPVLKFVNLKLPLGVRSHGEYIAFLLVAKVFPCCTTVHLEDIDVWDRSGERLRVFISELGPTGDSMEWPEIKTMSLTLGRPGWQLVAGKAPVSVLTSVSAPSLVSLQLNFFPWQDPQSTAIFRMIDAPKLKHIGLREYVTFGDVDAGTNPPSTATRPTALDVIARQHSKITSLEYRTATCPRQLASYFAKLTHIQTLVFHNVSTLHIDVFADLLMSDALLPLLRNLELSPVANVSLIHDLVHQRKRDIRTVNVVTIAAMLTEPSNTLEDACKQASLGNTIDLSVARKFDWGGEDSPWFQGIYDKINGNCMGSPSCNK